MSDQVPAPSLAPQKENWTGRLGVVLAVAGSAVGLGNFLRFPGQAVNNGGGAFMIPYIISFLLLGIPICWCEWTLGRMGGRYGQSSAPGIYQALWRHPLARYIGAFGMMIPIVIFMYYVFLEAVCMTYAVEFARGTFSDLFAQATAGVSQHDQQVSAVTGAAGQHLGDTCGMAKDGSVFAGGMVIWCVLICFAANFYIIYRGITRGIEWFCTYAMPLLIGCALIVLVRALTLPNITDGLGFMWNPDWAKLKDPQVWLAASSQIFFSLSVGFGLILTYASYLRPNDDVVLSGLTASSLNEFCEVILAGLTIVPVAFIFLGAAAAATPSAFGLGFVTVPSIMHFMPAGRFFGTMWFGLLTLAAITSSLSMLQPAIAFLEDGFGLRRHGSTILLAAVSLAGAAPVLYFSRDLHALDVTDFWVGNFMIFVAATAMVIIFGWVIGVDRGLTEAARGAELAIPRVFRYLIRYVTPAFLLVIFVLWCRTNAPERIHAMMPDAQADQATRAVYEQAAFDHFVREALGPGSTDPGDPLPPREQLDPAVVASAERQVAAVLGDNEGLPLANTLPAWLLAHQPKAEQAGADGRHRAVIARGVFVCLICFLLSLFVLSEWAYRHRIRHAIFAADRVEQLLADQEENDQ
ncbi:MAG TPA: hypothetical protein VMZ31_10425 [Phycisphaerae bacterium]|nr:hypothetical protein [Phycisphaerae bacterium]